MSSWLLEGEEERHEAVECRVQLWGRPHTLLNASLQITNFRAAFLDSSGRLMQWVALACIASVDKRGSMTSTGVYAVLLRCSDVRELLVHLPRTPSVRSLLVGRLGSSSGSSMSLEAAFALSSASQDNLQMQLLDDFGRMGALERGWRHCALNAEYALCGSYPRQLVVPGSAEDSLVEQVAAHRSRQRLPVLSWLSGASSAALMRCSQPRSGIRKATSEADARYCEALRELNPETDVLVFYDARPQLNAVANQAKGGGTEVIRSYQRARLVYLNIGNIHVMRKALENLQGSLVGDVAQYPAAATEWLSHIALLLSSSKQMATALANKQSSVVHCSDGWDRTAQLASLACLLIDPHYRSIEGFLALIHREWISYGHKFSLRHGVASSSASQRSPIFLQFLDCCFQMLRQFPSAFEWNSTMLVFLFDSVLQARFGDFLGNCEKDRQDMGDAPSAFIYILKHRSWFSNRDYSPDEGHQEEDSVLDVRYTLRSVALWEHLFLRHTPEAPQGAFLDESAPSMEQILAYDHITHLL